MREANLHFVDERNVIEENDAVIAASATLGDHCAIINATLALLSQFFKVREARTADESSIIGLGARVYNSSAAGLYLTRSGYYQIALMLVRDLIEVTNLLDYFLTNKKDIEKWRTLPDRQRRKLFDPAPVRQALNARDALPRDVRKEYYSTLSEAAVHATFRGLNLLAKDDKRMAGPFSDRPLTEAVLSLLPLFTVVGGQVFQRHFGDVDEPVYLGMLATYNKLFLAWQRKHLPDAIFK